MTERPGLSPELCSMLIGMALGLFCAAGWGALYFAIKG